VSIEQYVVPGITETERLLRKLAAEKARLEAHVEGLRRATARIRVRVVEATKAGGRA